MLSGLFLIPRGPRTTERGSTAQPSTSSKKFTASFVFAGTPNTCSSSHNRSRTDSDTSPFPSATPPGLACVLPAHSNLLPISGALPLPQDKKAPCPLPSSQKYPATPSHRHPIQANHSVWTGLICMPYFPSPSFYPPFQALNHYDSLSEAPFSLCGHLRRRNARPL
ncbi:hypothetical protein K438DRAFT_600686 [Mycena galopus ATCC 62051]|nr:hypothetical protein K438DRAFT_600686 [Mycena galopus ATCC 62051]